MSIAAAAAVSIQQLQLSVERAPRLAAGEATFGFTVQHVIVNDRPAQVLYIDPRSPDAPVPPGLSAMPAPGTAVLSPALADEWQPPGLETVGEISPDALASPDERIAIVVPPESATLSGFWADGEGYGSSDLSSRTGVTLYAPSIAQVATLFTLTLVIPAFVLLVSATRNALRLSEHAVRILEVLGATPRALRRAQLQRLLLPLSAGIAGALACTAVVALKGLHLPYVDFALPATHLQAQWPVVLGGCVIGAVLTALAASRVCQPPTPVRVNSEKRRRWIIKRRGLVTAVAIIVAIFSIGMANQIIRHAPQQFLLWFCLAVLSTLVLAPLLCQYLAEWLARAIRWIGTRGSKSSAIIASRQIQSDRGNWQYAAVISTLLLVVSQVFVAHMVGLAQAKEAREVRDGVGSSYTTITVNSSENEKSALSGVTQAAFADVPNLLLSIRMDETTAEMNITLTGSASALEGFGLEPGADIAVGSMPGPLAQLVRNINDAPTANVVEAEPFPEGSKGIGLYLGSVVIVDVPAGSAELDAIESRLGQLTAPAWRLQLPGDGFVAGADEILTQGRWFAFVGVAAAIMLSAATLLRQTSVMDRTLMRVAPIASISGKLGLGASVIAIQVLTMVAVGTLIGGTLGITLGSILTSQGAGAGPPYGPVAIIAASCVVCALVAVLGYWRRARSVAASWSPTARLNEG
ncbi:hypothetical protein [Cellulosimicrobium cellulans]|uniref:hypothetical protein n=1 Tax=Cellulosimicrobium cellulans TaxID=1710 RepID=UPI0020CF7274|nr:hypothetical protein NMQ07_12955 [Cellulosimicrobium cellulans]